MRFRLVALALLALAALTRPALAQERALGSPSDVKTCLNCHDAPEVTGVLHTAHAVKADPRTGIAVEGCQNCHGDSRAHAARPADGQPRPKPAVVFSGPAASPVAERNKACLGCHQGGAVMHWEGSKHETADLACVSCHAAHPTQDPVLVKTKQAFVCFTCHAEQRAASMKPSHHPVTEGIMSCSDCHNPMGSPTAFMLKGNTVNETCYACHDEKRGPFLWEHAPVAEDCTICHTPHGSVQTTLLKQRPPFLCQNCHDESLHNSQPFSGNNLPGMPGASRQLVLGACINCHSEVHGSNHPSGVRFAR
jgi:DmsE family decaheme c-type cytochrome